MKIGYVIIGYVGVALILAIGIEVSAKVASSNMRGEATVVDGQAAESVASPGEATPVKTASRASCKQFVAKQKEATIEITLALMPEKGATAKKQRRKARQEISDKMDAAQEELVAACTELPQTEIDCVLAEEDAMAWAECGPNIAKLGNE